MYKKIILLSLIIIPLYIFPATGKVKGIKNLRPSDRIDVIKSNLALVLPRPSMVVNPFASPSPTWQCMGGSAVLFDNDAAYISAGIYQSPCPTVTPQRTYSMSPETERELLDRGEIYLRDNDILEGIL